MKTMNTLLTALMIVMATGVFSQTEMRAPSKIETVDTIQPCKCGCFSGAIGLIDFQGNQHPTITFGCSDYESLIIKRLGQGLYVMYLANGDLLSTDRTFLYFQSSTSSWREIQAEVHVDGKIYINTYQNGVHTDIVTQNSSFRVMNL